MFKSIFGLLIALLILTACVSTEVREVYGEGQLTGPREIALITPRSQAWVVEIESRLRDEGFQIRRFPSVERYYQIVSETEARSFNQASARAIVVIDGFAPNTSMTRCLGGGYLFEYIDVEIIDAAQNETVARYNSAGHSENCPPISGTIFGDVVELVNAVFE